MKYIVLIITFAIFGCGTSVTPLTPEQRRVAEARQAEADRKEELFWQERWAAMSDESLLTAYYQMETQIAAASREAAGYQNSINSSQTSLGASLAQSMFAGGVERKVAGLREAQVAYRIELNKRGIRP